MVKHVTAVLLTKKELYTQPLTRHAAGSEWRGNEDSGGYSFVTIMSVKYRKPNGLKTLVHYVLGHGQEYWSSWSDHVRVLTALESHLEGIQMAAYMPNTVQELRV